MFNILFISNDKRINGLISYLQPLLKTAIDSTADFDEGLKDVFDKRPALVFIQRKIGSVSGDVVAQHIRELLRANRPKIILLQDEAENVPVSGCYDDSVGFVLPEPDVYKAFHKYLQKFSELPWRDQETPESAAAADDAVKPVEPAGVAPSAVKKVPAQKPNPKPVPPVVPASVSASVSVAAPSRDRAESSEEISFAFPASPPRQYHWGLWWAAAGVVVVICVWAWVAFVPVHSNSKQPVQSKSAGPGGEQQAIHLPAIVLANAPDDTFAAQNPGWLKYTGPRVEFRVFREKGQIRVIQTIIHGEPLGDEFLTAFLQDVFGKNDCRVTSSAAKDGFVIQSVVAPRNSEMIVYRQEKTNRIKGFVLSFS